MSHKELVEELLKLKKLEREEPKEKKDNSALEESYKKIRALAAKQKPQKEEVAQAVVAAGHETEVKKEEKEQDTNLIQSLLSLFKK